MLISRNNIVNSINNHAISIINSIKNNAVDND